MAINWDTLIKNHIPGRDWITIRNVWAAASRSFDPDELLDLSDAVEPILSPGFEARDNSSVIELPGGAVAAFNDAAATVLKCAYVLRSVGNCLLGGQPTWAAVDAYHFSFLAGRSLLALLGIHFIRVADSHGVLDIFPTGISSQETNKFKRLYPHVREPARFIYRVRSEVPAQRVMWALLIRAINVTEFETALRKDLRSILDLGEGFSRSRNEILYQNSAWLYEEDFHQPSCAMTINDDIHSYAVDGEFFLENRDANFAFAAVLARVLWHLVADIQAQGGADILDRSAYGHCLTKFAGFKHDILHALYSTIYRREAYGAPL